MRYSDGLVTEWIAANLAKMRVNSRLSYHATKCNAIPCMECIPKPEQTSAGPIVSTVQPKGSGTPRSQPQKPGQKENKKADEQIATLGKYVYRGIMFKPTTKGKRRGKYKNNTKKYKCNRNGGQ